MALAPARGWHASLALGFERVGARSVLVRRAHRGPLVVQKPLYPEGGGVCQCVVIHPPAGVAGGDRVELSVDVGAGAHAQLTTPGATRWYRSDRLDASQVLAARVDGDGVLEWLPQGTIVHDGAHARATARIELTGPAVFIGAEVVSLGRVASGERFRCGRWRQCLEIVRDGELIWSERAALTGDCALLSSPVGLDGHVVFGTFVATGCALPDTLVATLRALVPFDGQGCVTRLPGLVVARYLGNSMEAAGRYFMQAWSLVRPPLTGRAALPPRIWST